MKKILLFITLFFVISKQIYAESLKSYIIPESTVIINNPESGRWLLYSIFEYFRNSIFWVLALIAVWVFIYIWFKILIARGNPEEFKKAIMHFVYAIIWLVVIALSWWMVRMISSLTL